MMACFDHRLFETNGVAIIPAFDAYIGSLTATVTQLSGEGVRKQRRSVHAVRNLLEVPRVRSWVREPAVRSIVELSSELDAAAAALRGERDAAKRVLDALVKTLEDKKTRAFEQVKLDVPVPTLNAGVVDAFNQVLLKHNRICDEFQSRIDSARRQPTRFSSAARISTDGVSLGHSDRG